MVTAASCCRRYRKLICICWTFPTGTIRAAVDAGRRGIGVESNLEFVTVAAERMRQQMLFSLG
jgi:hypothetical protein